MLPSMMLGGVGRIRRVAGGSSDAARWVRIQITANNGDSFYCIQEVEFRLSAAGADITTTATPVTATSTLSGSYPAVKMVDNNTTNDQEVWVSASAPGTVDLIFDLGAGFDFLTVAEIAIMPQNNGGVGPGRAPKDFTISYGPTSAGSWTLRKTVTNSTGWTAGVYRDFAIP